MSSLLLRCWHAPSLRVGSCGFTAKFHEVWRRLQYSGCSPLPWSSCRHICRGSWMVRGSCTQLGICGESKRLYSCSQDCRCGGVHHRPWIFRCSHVRNMNLCALVFSMLSCLIMHCCMQLLWRVATYVSIFCCCFSMVNLFHSLSWLRSLLFACALLCQWSLHVTQSNSWWWNRFHCFYCQ